MTSMHSCERPRTVHMLAAHLEALRGHGSGIMVAISMAAFAVYANTIAEVNDGSRRDVHAVLLSSLVDIVRLNVLIGLFSESGSAVDPRRS